VLEKIRSGSLAVDSDIITRASNLETTSRRYIEGEAAGSPVPGSGDFDATAQMNWLRVSPGAGPGAALAPPSPGLPQAPPSQAGATGLADG